MFEIVCCSLLYCAIDILPDELSIVRVRAVENQFPAGFDRLIIFSNSKCFLGPEDFSAGNIPTGTARVAKSLGFREIDFAMLQGLLGALTLEYFVGQFSIESGQLAGPFQNSL